MAMNFGIINATTDMRMTIAANSARSGFLSLIFQAVANNTPDKVNIAIIWFTQPAIKAPRLAFSQAMRSACSALYASGASRGKKNDTTVVAITKMTHQKPRRLI